MRRFDLEGSDKLFFFILVVQLFFYVFLLPIAPRIIYFFGNFIYGPLIYVFYVVGLVLLGLEVVLFYLGYKRVACLLFGLIGLFNVANWIFLVRDFGGILGESYVLVEHVQNGGLVGAILFAIVLVLLVLANLTEGKKRFAEVLNLCFLVVIVIVGGLVLVLSYRDFVGYEMGLIKLRSLADEGRVSDGVFVCNGVPVDYVNLCYYKLPFVFKEKSVKAYFQIGSVYSKKEAYDFFLVGLSEFTGSEKDCALISDFKLRRFCQAVVRRDCGGLEGFLNKVCLIKIHGY